MRLGVLCAVLVAMLAAPAALADAGILEATLSFTAPGPTEALARQNLGAILDEVVSSYGHLEPVVGEMVVVADGGAIWQAASNVTLTGTPAALLAVEEEYGGVAGDVSIRGNGALGLAVSGGSVRDIDAGARWFMGVVVFAALGSCVILGLSVWCRFVAVGLALGMPLMVCAVLVLLAYANAAPYILP